MEQEFQKGSQSTISSIQRLMEHQEWLKKQQQDVRDKIYLKEKGEDKPPTGFIKD